MTNAPVDLFSPIRQVCFTFSFVSSHIRARSNVRAGSPDEECFTGAQAPTYIHARPYSHLFFSLVPFSLARGLHRLKKIENLLDFPSDGNNHVILPFTAYNLHSKR